MKGRIHSIESFGAVDGPGIRTVFFLQGCPARCAYCHNPDTWSPSGGREIDIEEILRRAKKGRPYHGELGGVTFSGGEPLLQGRFLKMAIDALHEEKIHCAIDISGTYFDEFSEEAMAAADLILLDVKHVDGEKFHELTGRNQGPLVDIIEVINKHEKPIWIRQVILPGFNDSPEYIADLNDFVGRINTVDKIELLGYHNMAKNKYAKLGIEYKLEDLSPMNEEKLQHLHSLVKK